MYAAKAIYAVVMAALLAAQAIYVDNTLLTIVIAALVPLGVYLVPNKPAEDYTEQPSYGGEGGS